MTMILINIKYFSFLEFDNFYKRYIENFSKIKCILIFYFEIITRVSIHKNMDNHYR